MCTFSLFHYISSSLKAGTKFFLFFCFVFILNVSIIEFYTEWELILLNFHKDFQKVFKRESDLTKGNLNDFRL